MGCRVVSVYDSKCTFFVTSTLHEYGEYTTSSHARTQDPKFDNGEVRMIQPSLLLRHDYGGKKRRSNHTSQHGDDLDSDIAGSLGCWAITLKSHGFLYLMHHSGYTNASSIKALLVLSHSQYEFVRPTHFSSLCPNFTSFNSSRTTQHSLHVRVVSMPGCLSTRGLSTNNVTDSVGGCTSRLLRAKHISPSELPEKLRNCYQTSIHCVLEGLMPLM
ncbi:hypothetical protein EDD15DRAFT_387364 [Pisolithus albus]|nr:hypothetical protein EDD15DRAFT_387364 [Pisolithus albus]